MYDDLSLAAWSSRKGAICAKLGNLMEHSASLGYCNCGPAAVLAQLVRCDVAAQVQVVEVEWGGGADEAKLEQILKADTDKKIKAVAVVHNETTTGVTSDIGQVRQVTILFISMQIPYILRTAISLWLEWIAMACLVYFAVPMQVMDSVSHPALLLVDGVSSIGALDFRFDEWKVDAAVTGSQKALSLPTGLGLVAVSQKVTTSYTTTCSYHEYSRKRCSQCTARMG